MATATTEAEKTKKVKATPSYFIMTMEALGTKTSSKGMTTQAIKRCIVEKYPSLQETFSNGLMKRAITKGLENTEIARAKGSEDSGFKGRFLLNKTVADQKQKDLKRALKEKAKKASDKEKAAKAKKSPKAKKARSQSRSPTKAPSVKRSLSTSSGSPKPKKVVKPKKVAHESPATPKLPSKKPAKTAAKAKAPVKKIVKQPAAKVAVKAKSKTASRQTKKK